MPFLNLKIGSRKLISENAPKIFLISIIYLIFMTVMAELEFRLPGTVNAYSQFLERLAAGEIPGLKLLFSNLRLSGVALATVLWVMSSVLSVGYMSYCLKITRGISAGHKDLFDGFQFFLKVFIITIATTFLTILWSALFIFPGVVAHYRYRQAYYILLDDPSKSPMQCISESKRLMRGNKLDLFLLDLSFLGWFVLDLLVDIIIPLPFSFPVISILLKPYLGLTRASFYVILLTKLLV